MNARLVSHTFGDSEALLLAPDHGGNDDRWGHGGENESENEAPNDGQIEQVISYQHDDESLDQTRRESQANHGEREALERRRIQTEPSSQQDHDESQSPWKGIEIEVKRHSLY